MHWNKSFINLHQLTLHHLHNRMIECLKALNRSSAMAMVPIKLFNILTILSEALCLPSKNKKLMLSTVLLCFLPNSLLLMGNYISIYPLLLDFILKLYLISREDPNTPQFFDAVVGLKNDAEAFVHTRMLLAIASFIASTTTMMMIIHSSLLVCTGKQSTVTDVYSRIKSNWVNVFVTCSYFSLLRIGYTVLSVTSIAVPMLRASGSIVSIMIGGSLALLARLLYVYLAMLWMVGVVVSVAEESCSGLEALWRGGEIVKGRRLHGFLISLLLLLADGVLTGGYDFVGAKNATGLVLVNVLVLMKMFSHMVCTVFYCQCKKEASYSRVLQTGGEMVA